MHFRGTLVIETYPQLSAPLPPPSSVGYRTDIALTNISKCFGGKSKHRRTNIDKWGKEERQRGEAKRRGKEERKREGEGRIWFMQEQ